MDEETITRDLVAYLEGCHWTILQVHYPGSHGGLYFHPVAKGRRGSAGAVVVDIVAKHDTKPACLLVESKTRYSHRDVAKLVRLTTNPQYAPAIKKNFSVRSLRSTIVLRGIALPLRQRSSWPVDFLVFQWVRGKFKVCSTYERPAFDNLLTR